MFVSQFQATVHHSGEVKTGTQAFSWKAETNAPILTSCFLLLAAPCLGSSAAQNRLGLPIQNQQLDNSSTENFPS